MCLISRATASQFDSYEHLPARDFLLPTVLSNLQGGALMDNLPDGRLVMVTTRESAPFTTSGVELRIETAVGSRNFRYVGDLPLASGVGSERRLLPLAAASVSTF